MFIAWNPLKAIGEVILNFFLFLDAIVYTLVNWVYQIILVLCNINILGNDLAVQDLVKRIYVILGVIVLFLLAYSLLKSMVNPDEALKGKKSPMALLKDVLISVILIAVIPSIFEFALNFQNALLTKNTIGNIILGSSSSVGSSEEIINNGGMEIASGVLNAFIHPNYSSDKCEGSTASNGEVTYDCSNLKIDSSALSLTDATFDEFWDKMKASGSLFAITDLSSSASDGDITYYYIVSTVAGVFVLLVILGYCFEIAVRTIKLAVFELIAPLPILMRLLPNEQGNKTFGNWIRATISTYLEVFVRLGILFFSVLVVKIIRENFMSLITGSFTGEAGIQIALFAEMFLILGVILFVRQAPGMIKDLTGLDGNRFSPFKGIAGAFQLGAMFGGAATAGVNNFMSEKDANGNNKNMLRRATSGLAGFGSGFVRGFNEREKVKDFKSMRGSAHAASEAAIKKRIERENDKNELKKNRESYLTSLDGKTERNLIETGIGYAKYKAYSTKAGIAEWAGRGDFNHITTGRTKDLADEIDRNFSALEGTWKKSQAYIDKKAEADTLKNQEVAMKNELEQLVISGKSRSEAQLLVERKWRKSFADISREADIAKRNQEAIEKGEQAKKTDGIIASVKQIQLSLNKYSDIGINQEELFARFDSAEVPAIKAAVAKYSNLDDKNIEEEFKKGLKADQNSDEYKEVKKYIDYLDKLNLQAKKQKNDAAYQESQRASTFGSPKDKGGK